MIDEENIYKTVLHTNRLVLRFPRVSDAADLFTCFSDPKISQYSSWFPHKDIAHTKMYLRYLRRNRRRSDEIDFCILHQESGKAIGTCGFVRTDLEGRVGEIGYCLAQNYWHKGYAAEAVEALLEFGFTTLAIRRVEAKVVPANRASAALLERAGFTCEGVMKNGLTFKGQTHDLYLYAMTDSDYLRKRG